MKKLCKNGHEYEDDGKKSPFCPNCRSIMGRRSKRKGYTDEKRFEKFFQSKIEEYKLPYKIMRTPRSGGIRHFSPADFFFKFLPTNSWLSKYHIEKKDRANWDIIGWFEEATIKEKEFGGFRKPVIIARRPHDSEDYVVMKKEDW